MPEIHSVAIPGFPAPSDRYSREDESYFRGQVDRTLRDTIAYVTRSITEPVSLSGDITISKNTPSIFFDDTGTPREWNIGVNGTTGFFFISDLTGSLGRLRIAQAGGFATFLNGDVEISKATPALQFTDSGTPRNWNVGVNGTSGFFFISDLTAALNRFRINTDGHVLIGTATDPLDSRVRIFDDQDVIYALEIDNTHSGDPGDTIRGMVSFARQDTATIRAVVGIEGWAVLTNTGTHAGGTIGLEGLTKYEGTGTISGNANGVRGFVWNSAAGSPRS